MSESISEQTNTRVDAVIERLRQEYGAFEVVEKTWERSAAELDRIERQFEQDRLDGAGVWLTNDDGARSERRRRRLGGPRWQGRTRRRVRDCGQTRTARGGWR